MADEQEAEDTSEIDDVDFKRRLLSHQGGTTIDEIDPGVVRKMGRRVTRNEEAAFRLVMGLPEVSVPTLYGAHYFFRDGVEWGDFLMDLVEGCPLHERWDGFDDTTKEKICHDIWDVVERLRQIPRPPKFSHLYQCGADGSLSIDVLIKHPPSPIRSDEELRAVIYQRYLDNNGGSYPDNLLDFLPHSTTSVFTHGDLAPRNILVDSTGRITGIID